MRGKNARLARTRDGEDGKIDGAPCAGRIAPVDTRELPRHLRYSAGAGAVLCALASPAAGFAMLVLAPQFLALPAAVLAALCFLFLAVVIYHVDRGAYYAEKTLEFTYLRQMDEVARAADAKKKAAEQPAAK